jgi:hypothetical protein
MNRVDYENCYIDHLRQKFPNFEDFKKHFDTLEYVICDSTLKLTKDTRILILNKLRLPYICKLTRTSKQWYQVTKYDDYWRERYIKEFYKQPPNDKVPDGLWFDIYQYTWSVNHQIKYLGGRQGTLSRFIWLKKKIKILNKIIILEDRHPVSVFPIELRNLICKYYSTGSIRMVIALLLMDMYQNPTLYWSKVVFTKSHVDYWEVSKDSILIPNEYINGEMTTRKDFFHAIEAKLRKIITENYWNKVKTIS